MSTCIQFGEIAKGFCISLISAYALSYYSNYLSNVGRVEEAIQQARRADIFDPLSPIIVASVGSRLYYARRYAEAIAQFRKALELEPNFAITRSRSRFRTSGIAAASDG